MSHLPTDRLAALGGEAPTSEELAHLAICASCAREVRAYEALLAMSASERGGVVHGASLEMPLTRWDTLRPALRREQLIAPAFAAPRHRIGATPGWVWRVAAALLLVAGGLLAGRLSAITGPLAVATDKPAVPTTKPAEKPKPQPLERRGAEDVGFASATDLLPTTFASVDEARAWQQRLIAAYENAETFIATNDSSVTNLVLRDHAVRARLAALDRVGRVMRDALREAPADPVLNEYYFATLGQREATLRQISSASPADQRVIGF